MKDSTANAITARSRGDIMRETRLTESEKSAAGSRHLPGDDLRIARFTQIFLPVFNSDRSRKGAMKSVVEQTIMSRANFSFLKSAFIAEYYSAFMRVLRLIYNDNYHLAMQRSTLHLHPYYRKKFLAFPPLHYFYFFHAFYSTETCFIHAPLSF